MSKYPDYQSVASIFAAMMVESIDGMSLSDMVGGGYPMPVATHFMGLLADQAGLTDTDRVLDIGCGCGRLAAAMTQHIGPNGSYLGVDIVPGLIDFASRHITTRYPNFQFVILRDSNPAYDQWRHDGTSHVIAALDDACAEGSIDLCVATSLFTHLDTAMSRRTLRSVSRALSLEGRALFSLFLLDNSARAFIRRGPAAFQFEHSLEPGAYVQNSSGPLGALAFEYDHFVSMLTEQGLYVERTLYGNWAGRPHYVSGQDILIVRKFGHRSHSDDEDETDEAMNNTRGPSPEAKNAIPSVAHRPAGVFLRTKHRVRALLPGPYAVAGRVWQSFW